MPRLIKLNPNFHPYYKGNIHKVNTLDLIGFEPKGF
jgi:hypothetical protein